MSTIMLIESACSATSCSFSCAFSNIADAVGAPQVGRRSSMTPDSQRAPLANMGALTRSNTPLDIALGSSRLLILLSVWLPVSLWRKRRRL